MKLDRVSRWIMSRVSIVDVTSTLAPSFGIVQDRIVSKIVRPHWSMHVSMAILAFGHVLPLITDFVFGPLRNVKIVWLITSTKCFAFSLV